MRTPGGFWCSLLAVSAFLGAGRGQVGQLGQRCHPSGRCNVQLSMCIDNVCQCGEQAVPSSKNNRCLRVADGLEHYCEEDQQCRSPDSFCRRKIKQCDCRKTYIMSSDKTVCLPEVRLGEACLESAQCKGSTECSPSRRVCVCRGISYEVKGECVTDHNSRDWDLTVVTVSPALSSNPRAESRWLLCVMLTALISIGVR